MIVPLYWAKRWLLLPLRSFIQSVTFRKKDPSTAQWGTVVDFKKNLQIVLKIAVENKNWEHKINIHGKINEKANNE